MKGIILAGGVGTRLKPVTATISKQLLPVYDKPMIYYPLSTLMSAGIRDILIISSPTDITDFSLLLKDGSQFGISIRYEMQPSPDGLAQAFIIGEKFIANDECVMILGDNLFHGDGLYEAFSKAYNNAKNGRATIFGYKVKDPSRFGIVEFDENCNVLSVEEKPQCPKSDYAITGLYFYPKGVSQYAKQVEPSDRGEFEITALNELYLKEKLLDVKLLEHNCIWFDTGTVESLFQASCYVHMTEKRDGVRVSYPEEIAYLQGWITKEKLIGSTKQYCESLYGQQLKQVVDRSNMIRTCDGKIYF